MYRRCASAGTQKYGLGCCGAEPSVPHLTCALHVFYSKVEALAALSVVQKGSIRGFASRHFDAGLQRGLVLPMLFRRSLHTKALDLAANNVGPNSNIESGLRTSFNDGGTPRH